jgi:Fur family iron response transcriptional regulator
MQTAARHYSETDIADLLRRHGINPTTQRVLIARLLLARCTHMSAEEVYKAMNADGRRVSKATVYNTLGLLAQKGIVREVIADPNRVFYDPNTAPHHHFFDVTTGVLHDIDASQVQVTGLPPVPEGTVLEAVDVIVRLRQGK